jgi:hypothetical protein
MHQQPLINPPNSGRILHLPLKALPSALHKIFILSVLVNKEILQETDEQPPVIK